MTTYVYQTIPQVPGEEPRHFEFKQSMHDQPLIQHPDTGEPLRRVILGGFGIMASGKSVKQPSSSGGGCCGGSGCACH